MNNSLQEAMNVVHISKEDQDNVFAMLAAVLWFGNISFTVIDNENHVEVVADEGNGHNFNGMNFYLQFLFGVFFCSLRSHLSRRIFFIFPLFQFLSSFWRC